MGIIAGSAKMSSTLGSTYVGTEHLILYYSSQTQGALRSILNRYGLTSDYIKFYILNNKSKSSTLREENSVYMTPELKSIVLKTLSNLGSFNEDKASVKAEALLLEAVLRSDHCVGRKLVKARTEDIDSLIAEINLYSSDKLDLVSKTDFGLPLGDKAYLSKFGRDLTEKAAKGELDLLAGRREELSRIFEIMQRKRKSSPMILGQPGVGKSSLTEGLAIAVNGGDVPTKIKGHSVFEIDVSAVVAGSKWRGQFEERMKKIIAISRSPRKVILVIDEAHMLVGAGSSEGSSDASNIIKPPIARGEIKCVASTTLSEFRKSIKPDKALTRRFQIVQVDEPSPEAAIEILRGIQGSFESHHGVRYSEESISVSVSASCHYIKDRVLPDKAIDLLDASGASLACRSNSSASSIRGESSSALKSLIEGHSRRQEFLLCYCYNILAQAPKWNSEGLLKERRKIVETAFSNIVQETDVLEVMYKSLGLEWHKGTNENNSKIEKMESVLNKNVLGQAEAVSSIVHAIKRSKIGLRDKNRPISSSMFAGPTGVGKTELVKCFSVYYFGRKDSVIKIDMSEFMERHSVSKLIGSPPGYVGHQETPVLIREISRNPNSTVLFDEVEKAHPDIYNILLQVLDEGTLTDSSGEAADFRNAVIFMTSNLGAKDLLARQASMRQERVRGESRALKDSLKSSLMTSLRGFFRPELLNRLDEIVVFNALSFESLQKILRSTIEEVAQRIETLGITLRVTDEVINTLIGGIADSSNGARHIRRISKTAIIDPISAELLDSRYKKGQKILCECDSNGKICFSSSHH